MSDEKDVTEMQYYALAVTYTEQGRVGMLLQYRPDKQTIDIEWCFSTDGVNWQRADRKPWIKRGEPGVELDSYVISPPGSLVYHENKWWLFYTGHNTAHNVDDCHGKEKFGGVMLATCDDIFG